MTGRWMIWRPGRESGCWVKHPAAAKAAQMGVGRRAAVKADHSSLNLRQPPLLGHLVEIAVHRSQAQTGHLRFQGLIHHFRRWMLPAVSDRLVDPFPLVGKALSRHGFSPFDNSNCYCLCYIICFRKKQALFQKFMFLSTNFLRSDIDSRI